MEPPPNHRTRNAGWYRSRANFVVNLALCCFFPTLLRNLHRSTDHQQKNMIHKSHLLVSACVAEQSSSGNATLHLANHSFPISSTDHHSTPTALISDTSVPIPPHGCCFLLFPPSVVYPHHCPSSHSLVSHMSAILLYSPYMCLATSLVALVT